ncbi:high-temperature-induced dauer-formation protein-domain-containing protein [Paraphysoderma sedebokerense]|nr:high-temperature-induced dauer-formation protein-domain-containing protein [Paraphysoderma sedebokerense]
MGNTESQLSFRKSVFRLYSDTPFTLSELEYFFDSFWTLPQSVDDIFSLFGVSDIQRIRANAPQNLKLLIHHVSAQLFRSFEAHNPRSPTTANTRNLLNCIRLLTRLLPFVYETTPDNLAETSGGRNPCISKLENDIMWQPVQIKTRAENQSESSELLAHRLCRIAVDLLFLENFTIPKFQEESDSPSRSSETSPPNSNSAHDSRVKYVIFETGIGSKDPINSTNQHLSTRLECLRLLLTLTSKSMYMSPKSHLTFPNPYLHFITNQISKPALSSLLCGLLNTVCKYNPSGWLPYDYVLFKDQWEPLAITSLHVLNVLLDYKYPGSFVTSGDATPQNSSSSPSSVKESSSAFQIGEDMDDHSEENGSAKEALASSSSASPRPSVFSASPRPTSVSSISSFSSLSAHHNQFNILFSKIHRPKDFEYILTCLLRLLSNPIQTTVTILPGSSKQVSFFHELLSLIWQIATSNQRFLQYLMTQQAQLVKLTTVLLYYSLDYRNEQSEFNLIRMCVYLLQQFSSFREFGVALNAPYEANLPGRLGLPIFTGCYGDFVIIALYTILTTSPHLHPLHSSIILTISNFIPLIKSLQTVASSKLLNLFSLLSSPGYLLNGEGNWVKLKLLLEGIESAVEYQCSTNHHLIYAILLNHKKFEVLQSLSFESAYETYTRRLEKQQLKKHQRSLSNVTATSESSTGGGTTPEQETISNPSQNSSLKDSKNAKGKASLSSLNLPSQEAGQERSTKWEPSEEWFNSWKPQLPLYTIYKLLSSLLPSISSFLSPANSDTNLSSEQSSDPNQLLSYLSSTTLTGLLPTPSPIRFKKFNVKDTYHIWFTGWLWAVAFVRHKSVVTAAGGISGLGVGIWVGTERGVKLFRVQVVKSGSPANGESAGVNRSS